MSNPFSELKKPKQEDVEHDEWGGQFDCSTRGCLGWANIAKYFPKVKVLAWECQYGHISRLEDVNE